MKDAQAQWASAASRAERLIQGARWAGAIAGAASAAYDIFINTVEAYNANRNLTTILYVTNGLISLSIAFSAFWSITMLWPLLLASIVLSFAIAAINAEELKKWISKCYFSIDFTKKNTANSYK